MKKPLVVVRINRDYDAKLLEELSVETVKPWGEFLEFAGVEPNVDSVEFDPPIKSEGVALWVMDLVRRQVEYDHRDTYVLAVMPHPIMSGTKTPSPGWGNCHVAFVSTHNSYMDPGNRRAFLKYGSRVAAHELGHTAPFELTHHESRVYTPQARNCLMYVGDGDRQALDRMDMGFCGRCLGTARTNWKNDTVFDAHIRAGKHKNYLA